MPKMSVAKVTKTSDEVKAEKSRKFKELGTARTNVALKKIDQLGKLANTKVYGRNITDANKIISALRAAIDELEEKFEGKPTREAGFSLVSQE